MTDKAKALLDRLKEAQANMLKANAEAMSLSNMGGNICEAHIQEAQNYADACKAKFDLLYDQASITPAHCDCERWGDCKDCDYVIEYVSDLLN